MPLRQLGFRIEGINVRRPAIRKDMNHPFCSGREMRLPHFQRIETHRIGCSHAGREDPAFAEHSPQRQRAHAHPAALQKVAARQEKIIYSGRVMGHSGNGTPKIPFIPANLSVSWTCGEEDGRV